MNEAVLIRAYAGPARVEPCACGGSIFAPSAGVADVIEAVVRHNATREHARWRYAALHDDGPRPAVDVRDLSGREPGASAVVVEGVA